MAISDELLKELAVLSQARNPVFVQQGSATYDPDNLPGPPGVTDGEDLAGAIWTLVRVRVRVLTAIQTNYVTIEEAVNGQQYDIDINSSNFNYTTTVPPDDVDDIAAALKTAIEAGSEPVAVLRTANVLTIKATTGDSFTISVDADVDPDDISLAGDATYCTFTVWGWAKGEVQAEHLDQAQNITIDRDWMQRFPTSGLDKLFAEPTATDGDVRVFIGPCLEEE